MIINERNEVDKKYMKLSDFELQSKHFAKKFELDAKLKS